MSTRRFFGLALAVVLSAITSGCSSCYQSLTPHGAYQALAHAETFASPHVGFAGAPSREGCSFVRLLRSSHPHYYFTRLLREESLVARLYGLCGLFMVDRKRFLAVLATDHSRFEGAVPTQSGCLLSFSGTEELLTHIIDGHIPYSLAHAYD